MYPSKETLIALTNQLTDGDVTQFVSFKPKHASKMVTVMVLADTEEDARAAVSTINRGIKIEQKELAEETKSDFLGALELNFEGS